MGEAVGLAAANLLRSVVGIAPVAVPSLDDAVDANVIDAAIAALSDPALAKRLADHRARHTQSVSETVED